MFSALPPKADITQREGEPRYPSACLRKVGDMTDPAIVPPSTV
jgi:hypothetical protein